MTRISLAERGAQISAKRAAGTPLPAVSSMVNSGARRTEQKRALLRAMADAAAKRGEDSPFTARY